jgi:hypothetical protein
MMQSAHSQESPDAYLVSGGADKDSIAIKIFDISPYLIDEERPGIL